MDRTLGILLSALSSAFPDLHGWLPKHLPPVADFIAKVIAEFLVAAFGVIFFSTGERIARHWRRNMVRLRRLTSGRRFILLWIDTDIATVRRVANRLKKNFPYVRVRALKDPKDILLYPLRRSAIEAVILISTDVNKLSPDDRVRRKIEDQLKEYILDGGGLVAGHDIIYRRTRNEWLSEAFGGQIRGWDRKAGPVPYQKSAAGANHPIGRRLPDQFSLEDGEVLFVSWNEGTEILFQEAGVDNPVHGLVMARTYETGRLVWLNSCDHGDRLASSIEKPSGEFVQLLSASVEWVAGSKQLAPGAPLIVAHRGVKDLGVENTMAAFRGAITLEADFIECDIRRTRDQVLVLHHDENLGAATISETSFSDLELAARAAALPLTRLEDLLEVAKGRIGLDLELKESGYEDQVVAMIRNHNISPESFVVTSFLEAAVVRFKECYGEAKCGLLLGDRSWWRDWYPVNRLRRSGVDFVAAKDRLVRMGFARRLASKGFPVWVWTVNDPLRMEKLLQMTGVEAVITDRVRMGKKAQRRARHE